jgi:hypothetical protein
MIFDLISACVALRLEAPGCYAHLNHCEPEKTTTRSKDLHNMLQAIDSRKRPLSPDGASSSSLNSKKRAVNSASGTSSPRVKSNGDLPLDEPKDENLEVGSGFILLLGEKHGDSEGCVRVR